MVAVILENLTDADYFARPELSASGCKVLLQPGGPARFAWLRKHGQAPRRTFDVGHAAHKLVLGKGDPIETIPAEVLSIDGRPTTKAAREWVADARERGVIPLTPTDWELVHNMADALAKHPAMVELLGGDGAQAELVLTAEIDGVPFRGKLDLATSFGALDYKTTAGMADADTFSRVAHRYAYDVQCAAYLELLRANGWFDPTFTFLVQEKQPPYLPAAFHLDETFLDLGKDRLTQAIALYRQCSETNTWPGHPDTISELVAPAWAFDDDDLEIEI